MTELRTAMATASIALVHSVWWKRRVNQHVFSGAWSCVAWSSWTAQSIMEDYGVEPDRVNVIPPGVDTSRLHPSDRADGPVRILFVGGEFERKGGDLLLRAFAQLPGDPELVLVTKSKVPRADRVTVISDLAPNDDRLIELFRTSDIFALPSRAETFGIAAVEASAAALPVVATNIGGLSDIVVDGETGLLLPVADVSAVTTALNTLIYDAELRRRLGANARSRALEKFDGPTNAGRLFDLATACAINARSGHGS